MGSSEGTPAVGLFALIYTVLGLIGDHIGHLPGMYQSHNERCTGQSLSKMPEKCQIKMSKNVMLEKMSDK